MNSLGKKKGFLCAFLIATLLFSAACSAEGAGEPERDSANGVLPEDGGEPNDGLNHSQESGLVDVILNSFSTKQFRAEDVSAQDLELILKAGLQAASARNMQPWHFTVVTDFDTASQFAQVEEGMAAIVISGSTEEMEGVNVDFDCGLATGNMYNAAQALGLGAHIYSSPVRRINEELREALEIPEGYEAVAIMTVGHMADREDAVTSATSRNSYDEMMNIIADR